MNSPLALAFFWRGLSTRIPEMLVESARVVHGKECHVTQVSDIGAPEVKGVDQMISGNFDENIMVARLQAYCRVPVTQAFTYFCDADSLVLSKLALLEANYVGNIVLNRRQEDAYINANWPERYPEFEGRTLMEMMPFLFGGIAVRRDESLFHELLALCKNLHPRFWRWYGDQISLKRLWDSNPRRFEIFPDDALLKVVRNPLTHEDVGQFRRNGTKFITFKGPQSKSFMEPTLQSIKFVYGT